MHLDALRLNQGFWSSKGELHNVKLKHCQRHNRPNGWVHITSCYTNLDQISSSEYRPNINFRILTKIQLYNLNKTFNFKILTKPCAQSLKISHFDFLTLIISVDNWISMDQMNVNCSNNFHFLWSECCLNLLYMAKSFVPKFWQDIIITLKMIVVRHKIQNYEEDIIIKHMKPIFFLLLSVTCIHLWLKQCDLAKSP